MSATRSTGPRSAPASGVALAAIRGLYEIVRKKEREIETLKMRLSKLESTK